MNERILQIAVACGIVAGAIVTGALFVDAVTDTAAQRRIAAAAAPAAPTGPDKVATAATIGTDDDPLTTVESKNGDTTADTDGLQNDRPDQVSAADDDGRTNTETEPEDEVSENGDDEAANPAMTESESTDESSIDAKVTADDDEAADANEPDSGDTSGFDTSEPSDNAGESEEVDGIASAEDDGDAANSEDDRDAADPHDEDESADGKADAGDEGSETAEEDAENDADGSVLADDEDGDAADDDDESDEAGPEPVSASEGSAATPDSAAAAKPLNLTPGNAPPAPPPVPSVGASPGTASQQAALPVSGTLKLDMPIRCSPGDDCWIVNYVDLDGSPDVRDYTCAKASYDDHKGTDIAVRDMAAVQRGVAVIAAAPGVVVGSRDGMPDISFKKIDPKVIKSRECGNGVIVGHPDGWTTQYCHMRKGSITVAKGDSIVVGQVLGMVGHSGRAEFPHLHFQIRKGAAIVDPFVGLRRARPCGPERQPLWRAGTMARLPYQPSAVFNAGFSETPPPGEIGRQGNFHRKVLGRGAPKFVLWADVFWVQPGDTLVISVEGPGGKKILNHKVAVQKLRAYRMIAATLRGQGKPWAPGIYRGEVRLLRADGLSSAATATVTLR